MLMCVRAICGSSLTLKTVSFILCWSETSTITMLGYMPAIDSQRRTDKESPAGEVKGRTATIWLTGE